MSQHPHAVRQMRANFKRRHDLVSATNETVDQRIRGVLIWLNAPALPVDDAAYMADLRTALAFGSPLERSRAAWLLAALCHREQQAVRRETCGEERLAVLLSTTGSDLRHMRELVIESLDAMWFMAPGGRHRHYSIDSPAAARQAGAMPWSG